MFTTYNAHLVAISSPNFMKILKVLKEILKTNLIAEKEMGVWTSKLGETFNEGGHRPYVKK